MADVAIKDDHVRIRYDLAVVGRQKAIRVQAARA